MDWIPEMDMAYGQKIEMIRRYLESYGLRTMIETGLYNGNGSGMQMLDLIDDYLAIDLSLEQCEAAWSKGFACMHGDSGQLLPTALLAYDEPVLFWLDAHLVSEADEPNHSPLMAELDAILAWPHHAASVLLIDDVRMMGRDGWPTAGEVIDRGWECWDVEELDDVLRFTPIT